MKEKNSSQFFKIVSAIFIITIIYSSLIMYPNYGSSYNFGFSVGLTFGHTMKIVGTIGLFLFGILKIKNQGVKQFD
jgi:hypothetical protein